MKKLLKTILASFMILTLTVLSSCWLDAAEHMSLTYNSVEEFVADFGSKIEKQDSEDVCCMFEDDSIKTSVEGNLQCTVVFSYLTVHVIRFGGDLKPIKYQFEKFSCIYNFNKDDKTIGWLGFSNGKPKGEIVNESVVIDEVELCINKDSSNGNIYYAASFQIENAQGVLSITLTDAVEGDFTVDEFINLITPIMESRYVLK